MKFFGDFQIIIGPAVKVENFAALGAMQMMVVAYVRVETLGAAENFDNINDTFFGKGQKGSVYGIKRDVRIFFFHNLINRIGGGMGVRY